MPPTITLSTGKSIVFGFVVVLLCSCTFLSKTNMDESIIRNSGLIFNRECPNEAGGFSYHNGLSFLLRSDNVRCEIASQPIAIPMSFYLDFTIQLTQFNEIDNEWFSVFQLHSFPDIQDGEKWRCPLFALEVVNSHLRMYSRWDPESKSILKVGTCAHHSNSIQDRLVFENFQFSKGESFHVAMKVKASYEDDGYIQIFINNKEVGSVLGPTAFNDKRGVFLKFGIYKPTNWTEYNHISVNYNDVNISVL